MSKRILKWAWLPIAALVAVNLLIGVLTVRNYGMGVDEPNIYLYATHSFKNYELLLQGSHPVDFMQANLDYYGPAFFTTAWLMARVFVHLPLSWAIWDGWHFSYFLSFQIALISLYVLCRRWMGPWAAIGAVLLFETQPVLWGQAFINPKDIPFMAAFLATIALGFVAVDRIAALPSFPEVFSLEAVQRRKWGGVFVGPALAQTLKSLANPALLLAAAVLGLTTSIRVLGPFAGILVALYALYKCPRRAPGVITIYALVAIIVSFLSWPFLWADPIHRIFASLTIMSDFPWNGLVLFEGRVIRANELPWDYLPKLMSLQFTEPAILLFMAGTVLAGRKAWKDRMPEPFLILVLWLILPLCAIILAGSKVYNGFRQVLFLIPPIFICGGLTLDWLFRRVRPVAARSLLLLLVLAPGIYWITALHPYEYIYFNLLAGGVRGAFANYDLDYWSTSFREAAQYINEVACPDAQVVVYRSPQIFLPYARPDLKVLSTLDIAALSHKGRSMLDFAVIRVRTHEDLSSFPKNVTVRTIGRDGAILAVVQRIAPVQPYCP